jgi:hypothetical protein
VSLVGFAGFCALLLILGAVLSGIAGVVYQSDTQNTYYTKIITSRGGVYNVTQTDLQLAVYSLNSTSGGFIFVPYGSDLTYSTLSNPYNVHFIDFESFATTGTITITAGS